MPAIPSMFKYPVYKHPATGDTVTVEPGATSPGGVTIAARDAESGLPAAYLDAEDIEPFIADLRRAQQDSYLAGGASNG